MALCSHACNSPGPVQAVPSRDKLCDLLQAERIVLKRTADVIDRELGHPPDWAPMTDSNTQLFEVDLSEPTVAGLVSSLKDVGGTVVKVSPASMPEYPSL